MDCRMQRYFDETVYGLVLRHLVAAHGDDGPGDPLPVPRQLRHTSLRVLADDLVQRLGVQDHAVVEVRGVDRDVDGDVGLGDAWGS